MEHTSVTDLWGACQLWICYSYTLHTIFIALNTTTTEYN